MAGILTSIHDFSHRFTTRRPPPFFFLPSVTRTTSDRILFFNSDDFSPAFRKLSQVFPGDRRYNNNKQQQHPPFDPHLPDQSTRTFQVVPEISPFFIVYTRRGLWSMRDWRSVVSLGGVGRMCSGERMCEEGRVG